MSLEDIIPTRDTPVSVGTMRRNEDELEIPVYIVDFGKDHPLVDDYM